MHAEPHLAALHRTALGRPGLDRVIAVAALVAFVGVTHYQTVASMVAIWLRNETFAHGFIVVPLFLYLVWRRRAVLATLRPVPCLPALAGMALAAAVGWLGDRINAVSVTQLAMVALVPLGVWTVLGTRIARELSFPLAFLFFAVPIGEFLEAPMTDWTANFTVLAIRASGVPILREGNMFTIPTGQWSVVEACSGLRYLIASTLVGVLFAYLSYRSFRRRAAFIAASIVVPIIANWLRAYLIVMLGHLTDNRLAVGVDHLIYGWIFFGAVMLLLFHVGARWREDVAGPSPGEPQTAWMPAAGRASPALPWAGAAAVALTLSSAMLQAQSGVDTPPSQVRLAPVPGDGSWMRVDGTWSQWHPDLAGPTAQLRETLARGDARIGLHVALFQDQSRRAKAVASVNQLVQSTNPAWMRTRAGTDRLEQAGNGFDVATATVASRSERLAVWQWFWVDGHVAANRYEAALRQALAALRGRDEAVAWVVIYTAAGSDEARARNVLSDAAATIAPQVDAMLRQATETR